jgi:hypothetical protein
MTSKLPALLTVLAGTSLAIPAQAAERWLLMARHGECAEVATLKRKIRELGDVNDPDAFVALMRKQGFEVTSSSMPVSKGKAQEVRVPAKELFLLFVTPEMCAGGARK